MRNFPSIEAFLAYLRTLPAAVQAAQRHGEEAAGRELAQHAKEMIGQERGEWPALADSTVREKQSKGYTGRVSATDPLYRTGELRISISFRVDSSGLILGSTDRVAPFHEFGTSRMPARPFIGATMFQHSHAVAETVAKHITAAIAGSPPPARKP